MRGIPSSRAPLKEDDLLSLDERIEQIKQPVQTVRMAANPTTGQPDVVLDESLIDSAHLQRELELVNLLMKASNSIVPSFYEGGDIYIANQTKEDVTDTDAERRAIHTVSNYYNTLGIFRDDFDKSLNDKMARNAYYAIGEKAIVDYFGPLEFTVKDIKDGKEVDKATDFLENPNPQDSFGDLKKQVIRDLIRYDAGVIVKSFKKGGWLAEIKAYMGTEFWKEQDRVPLIINVPVQTAVNVHGVNRGKFFNDSYPTYQGWWSHGYTERFWQRSRTGVYIPFKPEEISYFAMYPRTDGIYGTDFLKFLKYQMQYLIDSTKAAGKTFENGIVPSIVWEHPEMRSLAQFRQRVKEAQFNNQGANKFGSVIHAVNGEKVSSLAQSLHDMQWLEGQKFVAQLIWAMWGFSQEEFLGGGANRATAYVKRNITKSRMLYPLIEYFEQKINREVLPYIRGYRKSWRFEFIKDIDLDDQQKIAQIKATKITTLQSLINMNFPVEISVKLADIGDDLTTSEVENLTDTLSKLQLQQLQMTVSGTEGTDVEQQQAAPQEGRYNQEQAGTPGYMPINFSDYGLGGEFTETRTGEANDQNEARKAMVVTGRDGRTRRLEYDTLSISKAKVYIAHPGEAPSGRSVKRGNRGGYYYITAPGETATPGKLGQQAPSHHPHPGWGRTPGGGGEPGGGAMGGVSAMPGEGGEQIHIVGDGIDIIITMKGGILTGEMSGTDEEQQFLTYIGEQLGGAGDSATILATMVEVAQQNGLEVT